MKTTLFILMILGITIISCDNDDYNSELNINGDFIGIFERSGNTSNVELTFDNGSFSGESDINKFPALCNGSYSISGNIINFENACAWTAEFDWTLILAAEWTFSINNNELIMIKENGDKYTLTKQ